MRIQFFHSIATERYRRNSIPALASPDGTLVIDHAAKEEIISQSFKERLGTTKNPSMLFDLQTFVLPTPGLEELSIPFTKEEIDAILKSMPIDKSPGPDGFNGQFLKSCWHIIKEDIYNLCF
jgi:hypothetical protein